MKSARDVLTSFNLRSRGISIDACPSCCIPNLNVFEGVTALETRFEGISKDLEGALIGCYLNGPRESKAAELGVTGVAVKLLYGNGAPSEQVSLEKLVDSLEEQVTAQLNQHYSIEITANG